MVFSQWQHALTKWFVPSKVKSLSRHCYIYCNIISYTQFRLLPSTWQQQQPNLWQPWWINKYIQYTDRQPRREQERGGTERHREGHVEETSERRHCAIPSHTNPHPAVFDSPQARVALGCLAEEMVEKVSGVEVAQHDCRMRTWSSWSANPWLR